MRAMTKSAVRLAREALAVGESALPAYSSPFSRHDYTQAQLFALLTLKQFLRTDYRGLVTLVAEWTELRRALGLEAVPHYSTLCYAERRLQKGGPSPSFRRLLRPRSRRGAHPAGPRRDGRCDRPRAPARERLRHRPTWAAARPPAPALAEAHHRGRDLSALA